MRHGNHKFKLSRNSGHRAALIRNLAIELVEHGKIKTTLTKTKAVKAFVEKLVTKAREDSVAQRRLVYSKLNNKGAVSKLFSDIAPKFKDRNGGYTRIIKLADGRVGDNAPLAIISFVE